MRGFDSTALLEAELARVLGEALSQFRREADELNRVALCMESAAALLADGAFDPACDDAAAAVRAGAAHAASLLVTLQIRLASVEGIGVALALLRSPARAESGKPT